jgi:hypothetical protein
MILFMKYITDEIQEMAMHEDFGIASNAVNDEE